MNVSVVNLFTMVSNGNKSHYRKIITLEANVLNCIPAYRVKKYPYHVRLKVTKS